MTLLTGIHVSYWRQSSNLLGITEPILARVKPQDVIAVKLQHTRETNAPFITVTVPNERTLRGRQAAAYARAI